MAAFHNRISRKELKERIKNDPTPRITISFYCYYKIEDPAVFRNELYRQLKGMDILGRIYIASEGINAQISLPAANLDLFKTYLYSKEPLNGLRLNVAVDDDGKSFYVLDIKVRNKIVADGINDPAFDMANKGGYVNAEQFNQLTNDAETIVIDMRNHYEYEVGHFENAIEIPSDTFREQLPMAVDIMKDNRDKNIIMYCTGGIRCEKASAFMKHSGFKNVFHLEGGIINYVNEAKAKGLDIKFHGKNFVFDQRLGERVTKEIISQCHQCGKPADTHVNCVNDACHLLFIQCDECKEKMEGTCSKECLDFIHLPEEEQKRLRSGIDKGRNVFNKSKQHKQRLSNLFKPENFKGFFLFLFLTLFIQISYSQSPSVTISGAIKNNTDKTVLPFVTVVLKKEKDSSFVTGGISNEEGRFSLSGVPPGNYLLQLSYTGFSMRSQPVLVGTLSAFLDLGTIELQQDDKQLQGVTVIATQEDISGKMDKKSYSIASNITQGGGSVLQAIKNLPGITVSQDGKLELRGSDKVAVLIDGKQTALTGFGNQTGLDNLPASAIERIEIINNPSAKYDANGNAGIINIIYKKNKQDGFNGKAGIAAGLGALWQKKENLPTIRPQYKATPKINPSLSLNYRKNKVNTFLQADWLYTETLNKNEFVSRSYSNGTIILQQTKRNRNTHFLTTKAGIDWNVSNYDLVTVSGLFGKEKIIDRGDEPFFNADLSKRERLWKFLEDELKTTVIGSAAYQHKFKQAGHVLNAGFNYTFHREDEKYFFENILPSYTGLDSFALISDEHVADLAIDYVKPLKHGRLEAGFKFRYRDIPTNMQFKPGLNSPLDTNAGGAATYSEIIPALYGNYIYESKKIEAEIGLRIEYVNLQYKVNPNHNTYKSDGYDYTQPFPNIRLAYKINDQNKVSLFYNRRVDRPNEVDIRIFPKYDDAEIIKVGNPALQPQFTNTYELGYKTNFAKGFFYSAIYHRSTNGTIIRIATQVPPSTLIYTVFKNAGHSSNTGIEMVLQQNFSKTFSFNTNINIYRNSIDAFTVENKYPAISTFSAGKETFTSGNIKLNTVFHLHKQTDLQATIIFLAPDIIPQGKTGARFSADIGIKRSIQKGKGELFFNATDIFNTLRFEKETNGNGFKLIGTDYYETQVFRVGYNYKF